MNWPSLKSAPKNIRILWRWPDGHVEDVVLFDDERTGSLRHVLYDGDSFTENPAGWMPYPPVEMEESE